MPSTTLDPSRHATLIRIRHKHIIQAKHITNTLGGTLNDQLLTLREGY